MKSTILQTATTYLLPLLLLFSIFVLLRGHDLPGGGFVGGLIASIAFVLHAFAYGLPSAQALFKYHPGFLLPFGLTIALLSALLPLFFGKPLMTAMWVGESIPIFAGLATTLFFDIGVYVIVVGVTLTILFTISENV